MSQPESETMLCGVCEAPGHFTLQTRTRKKSVPENWELCRVEAIGICGTDYHIYEGKHPFLQYPRVIGHELSVRIVGGKRDGSLCVVNPYLSCGECRSCRRGKPNCCANIQVLGVHRDGGMCEYIAVPSGNLYQADGLTEDQAAMVEFLAIGAHAVSRSGAGRSDRVLVTGAGPIGLATALFARLSGAEVHLLDLSDARLENASRLFGFKNIHLPTPNMLTGELSDGFDVVFDATGNAKSIESGFPMVAHGGTTVLVSVVKENITFSDPEFHKRESQIIGSRNALKADFERVIGAIRNSEFPTDVIASEIIQLQNLPERFEGLVKSRENKIKILVKP